MWNILVYTFVDYDETDKSLSLPYSLINFSHCKMKQK